MVVDRGVIVAAGPSAAVAIPSGAKVIDSHGETLVPGLWDSHQHVSDDSAGPDAAQPRRHLGARSRQCQRRDPVPRRAPGERDALLMPHVYPSMLIDGKGPNTAQVGTSVASLDEALATVRKAHDDGFIAIKFYGTFNPAWVAPTAAEAHRLGMHVHGHIPAGMRTTDAIADGYDEITHIYFVMMQAMPDSVVNVSNGIARFEGPGRYAKDVDLNAEPMKSLIAEMAAKKIASDPTLVVAESLYVPENGDLGAAYAPFVGTLPPSVERGFRRTLSAALLSPCEMTCRPCVNAGASTWMCTPVAATRAVVGEDERVLQRISGLRLVGSNCRCGSVDLHRQLGRSQQRAGDGGARIGGAHGADSRCRRCSRCCKTCPLVLVLTVTLEGDVDLVDRRIRRH